MAFTEIDGRKVYLPGRNLRGYSIGSYRGPIKLGTRPLPLNPKSLMSDDVMLTRYIAAMIDRYPWLETYELTEAPSWASPQWSYTGKGKHKGTARYIALPRVVPNVEPERIAA